MTLPFKWLMLALLAALWPVWRWYVAGTLDGSNDGWGLLAAATAILLCWRERRELHAMHLAADKGSTAVQSEREVLAADGLAWPANPLALPARPLLLPSLLLLAYLLATLAGLSQALRALPGVLALAALACIGCFGRRIHLPLFALSLLALPLAATLQFYLGYPLRALAGAVSVALLQMNGLAVIREGALLDWQGQLISIDVPCSGVKMLWAAMYLTYTLAALYGFGILKTASAIGLALGMVVLGNAVRAAALFYTETGIVNLPPGAHTAIGLVVFAAVAGVIVCAMRHVHAATPAQSGTAT